MNTYTDILQGLIFFLKMYVSKNILFLYKTEICVNLQFKLDIVNSVHPWIYSTLFLYTFLGTPVHLLIREIV